jgi:hypothetical protein
MSASRCRRVFVPLEQGAGGFYWCAAHECPEIVCTYTKAGVAP